MALTCCLYCFRRCIIPEYTINIAEQREANRCHYEAAHNAMIMPRNKGVLLKRRSIRYSRRRQELIAVSIWSALCLLFINQDGFLCYGCPWRQRLYESVDYFQLPAPDRASRGRTAIISVLPSGQIVRTENYVCKHVSKVPDCHFQFSG